jgi:hypothetical protein
MRTYSSGSGSAATIASAAFAPDTAASAATDPRRRVLMFNFSSNLDMIGHETTRREFDVPYPIPDLVISPKDRAPHARSKLNYACAPFNHIVGSRLFRGCTAPRRYLQARQSGVSEPRHRLCCRPDQALPLKSASRSLDPDDAFPRPPPRAMPQERTMTPSPDQRRTRYVRNSSVNPSHLQMPKYKIHKCYQYSL